MASLTPSERAQAGLCGAWFAFSADLHTLVSRWREAEQLGLGPALDDYTGPSLDELLAAVSGVVPTFDPPPVLYETTLVVSHYARSDEEARQTAHSMGDLIFDREDVVKIEGSSGDETGRCWRTTTTERSS